MYYESIHFLIPFFALHLRFPELVSITFLSQSSGQLGIRNTRSQLLQERAKQQDLPDSHTVWCAVRLVLLASQLLLYKHISEPFEFVQGKPRQRSRRHVWALRPRRSLKSCIRFL
jgi:hypothetical protein